MSSRFVRFEAWKIDAAIVHVAGACPWPYTTAPISLSRSSTGHVAGRVDAPAELTALRLVVERIDAVIGHIAQDAGDLEMAPGVAHVVMRRQVGHLLVILEIGAELGIQFADGAGIDIVRGLLDRDREIAVLGAVGRPAELGIAQIHHPRGPPIVDDVRENVAIHEHAVGLTREQLAPFAIGMAQADRRLARIDAGAEHVELEYERDVAPAAAGRDVALDSEPALLRGEEGLAVAAEQAIDCRNLRRTKRVVPRRIDAVRIIDDNPPSQSHRW